MNTVKGTHVEQCHFYLTDHEKSLIVEKMKQAGISNLSAYIRKMALHGYILKLEIPEIKELISLMRYTSNNLNQIAKKANSSGITGKDLEEIQDNQERLWGGMNKILKRLGEIP